MRAGGQLAVALDLLLPAHVARLEQPHDPSARRTAKMDWGPTGGARRCHVPSRSSSSWPRWRRRAGWRGRGTFARRARAAAGTWACRPASTRRRSGAAGSAGLGGPWRASGSPCGPWWRVSRPARRWNHGGPGTAGAGSAGSKRVGRTRGRRDRSRVEAGIAPRVISNGGSVGVRSRLLRLLGEGGMETSGHVRGLRSRFVPAAVHCAGRYY